jgi:hypothetical protein
MGLAATNRHMRGIELTQEDSDILFFHLNGNEAYEYAIADRNDYAIMLARTTLAVAGCRATRDRAFTA